MRIPPPHPLPAHHPHQRLAFAPCSIALRWASRRRTTAGKSVQHVRNTALAHEATVWCELAPDVLGPVLDGEFRFYGENPTNGPKLRYCERYSNQRNCEPQNIVSFVTDFQVVLKDINGNEITPVCADKVNVSNAAPSTPSCSTAGKENQDKVHTAEIYLTVRSPNPINKTQKKYRIVNADRDRILSADKYYRETFYISVYLRNIVKI